MDKKASKTLPKNDRTRPFFQMHQPGKPQKNFPAKTNQFLIRTFYFLNYVSFASFVHEKSFNSRCYVQKWVCVKIEPKPMYRSFNNWEMNLSPFLFFTRFFLQTKNLHVALLWQFPCRLRSQRKIKARQFIGKSPPGASVEPKDIADSGMQIYIRRTAKIHRQEREERINWKTWLESVDG